MPTAFFALAGGGTAALAFYGHFAHIDTVILGAGMTFAGVLIGFMGTAISILLTVPAAEKLKELKYDGISYFDRIVSLMFAVVGWSAALALYSIASMVLSDSFGGYDKYADAIWTGLFVGSVVASYRALKVFAKLVKLAVEGDR